MQLASIIENLATISTCVKSVEGTTKQFSVSSELGGKARGEKHRSFKKSPGGDLGKGMMPNEG